MHDGGSAARIAAAKKTVDDGEDIGGAMEEENPQTRNIEMVESMDDATITLVTSYLSDAAPTMTLSCITNG